MSCTPLQVTIPKVAKRSLCGHYALRLKASYLLGINKKVVNEMSFRNRRSFDRTHGSRSRQGFNRSSKEMHKSVCADCGKECEVPFRPTRDRPVYCQTCWTKRRPPRAENIRRREYSREAHPSGPSPSPENVDIQILAELRRIREALEKWTALPRGGDDVAQSPRQNILRFIATHGSQEVAIIWQRMERVPRSARAPCIQCQLASKKILDLEAIILRVLCY